MIDKIGLPLFIILCIIIIMGLGIGLMALNRWIFRVNEIVKYQEKQYYLLKKIAEKQGVSEEELKQIRDL